MPNIGRIRNNRGKSGSSNTSNAAQRNNENAETALPQQLFHRLTISFILVKINASFQLSTVEMHLARGITKLLWCIDFSLSLFLHSGMCAMAFLLLLLPLSLACAYCRAGKWFVFRCKLYCALAAPDTHIQYWFYKRSLGRTDSTKKQQIYGSCTQ